MKEIKKKPEYYAGSKLTVYSKYLLIMSYTHAFYFEEAIFNFFNICKSFRKLLIKNYKIINENGLILPTRYFSSQSYLIRSSNERFRYYVDILDELNHDSLFKIFDLLIPSKNANPYQFYVKNHYIWLHNNSGTFSSSEFLTCEDQDF